MNPSKKIGVNSPCHCGSGRKYKKCHLDTDRQGRTDAPPRRSTIKTEAELIADRTSGKEATGDLRQLATLVVRENKTVLIVDERRLVPPVTPHPFVLFSTVMLKGKPAIDALQSIAAVRARTPAAVSRRMTGPRLLRENRADAAVLRAELDRHLAKAEVLRLGMRNDSLKAWRLAHNFELVTTPRGLSISRPEFAIVQNIARVCAERMGLRGHLLVVVDRATQNGLDPGQLRLEADELGSVCYRDEQVGCFVEVLGSTPEDASVGDWLRLPDYDAARAVEDDLFESFSDRVMAAPEGQVIFWPATAYGETGGAAAT